MSAPDRRCASCHWRDPVSSYCPILGIVTGEADTCTAHETEAEYRARERCPSVPGTCKDCLHDLESD